VNVHEERSWKLLVELGARAFMLGGKHALDLKPIRATNERKLRLLVGAVLGVVGRSGANRRHVDRRPQWLPGVRRHRLLHGRQTQRRRASRTRAASPRRAREAPEGGRQMTRPFKLTDNQARHLLMILERRLLRAMAAAGGGVR